MASASIKSERHDQQSGFTLVEILIVIVIIGILAGIVIFAVGNLTGSAQKNACSTEADSFMTAIQAYKSNPANAALPTSGGSANLSGHAGIIASNGVSTSSNLKYGVDGAATANHWGYAAATQAVTKDPATCK